MEIFHLCRKMDFSTLLVNFTWKIVGNIFQSLVYFFIALFKNEEIFKIIALEESKSGKKIFYKRNLNIYCNKIVGNFFKMFRTQ